MLRRSSKKRRTGTNTLALYLAEGYALLRRPVDAVRWLRICVTRGFVNYPFLAERDPFLESVRGDAAFQGLMGEVRQRWEALCSWA